MKRYLLTLFFLSFVSCASACAQLKPSEAIPDKDDPVLLELITTASGMVYPKEGDLLTMRLHDSGTFEYDDFPEQNPPQHMAGKVPITLKTASITAEELDSIRELAESADLQNAKESYASKHPHVDDRWVLTIRYLKAGKVKTIKATNFWDDRSDADRSKYPPSMVRLIEFVYKARSAAITRTKSINDN